MKQYTIILALVTLTFILALWELVGIWKARLEGLTKNVSRIYSHSVIVVFIIAGVIQSLYWQEEIIVLQQRLFTGVNLVNLPLLFLCALTAIISGIEALEVYRARKTGLTKNRSRLITHSLMFLFMAAAMSVNLAIGI